MKMKKISLFYYFGKVYMTAYNNYHNKFPNKNLFCEIAGVDNLEQAKNLLENQYIYIDYKFIIEND